MGDLLLRVLFEVGGDERVHQKRWDSRGDPALMGD